MVCICHVTIGLRSLIDRRRKVSGVFEIWQCRSITHFDGLVLTVSTRRGFLHVSFGYFATNALHPDLLPQIGPIVMPLRISGASLE